MPDLTGRRGSRTRGRSFLQTHGSHASQRKASGSGAPRVRARRAGEAFPTPSTATQAATQGSAMTPWWVGAGVFVAVLAVGEIVVLRLVRRALERRGR